MGENEIIAARNDRNRACAKLAQLVHTGRVRRHVYAVELDPTDREELFGSQAAGSAGPPENLDLLAHARASSPVMR
ncbi:MAG: hypothetical protein OXE57_13325, partial [Alphaproteobacteria bacterium]|nr:hypothetical protein [Alphaproteobacteria bacterium]